ncbi:MAG: EAL domain-containing protein [Arcobacter sp.]|nr:EAL domain-containing protein [Arcobacter sp.]|tara:strand:+ start:4541 stop:5611 length:1071 start_codon:yes stop_codon:yes gene_type:complete
MACNKCNEKILLEAKASKIYILSEFDELIEKCLVFFAKLGKKVFSDKGLITIDSKNTKAFFSKNINILNTSFNDAERNNIKIFIEYENGSKFNYQSMLLAKPLQRFINIIEDKEFFDIVNNETLTSHFQPIINMHDNSIYAYEALVRGVKEDGKLMYPDVLFKKSKANDLDFKLDKLCRETALKTAAIKKVTQKLFINFIPTAIYDPEFCLSTTEKWAKQLDFDPAQIVFEVVETELVKDQEHLKNILKYYRKQGYKIALDDVGEGYSSLNMLIELQPDIIKIDRNIIDGIDKNQLKQSVYKALYNIAKEHNIEVLAEGIETEDELKMIKSIGVDYAQGYYFAKPSSEPLRKIASL